MRESDVITLAHGAGGKASGKLIREVFVKAFGQYGSAPLQDSASLYIRDLHILGSRLAFTTDSYVVSPITFPGGDIGKLAVCGTVNDLAVSGANPLYLSAGFILEEGLAISQLKTVTQSMADAADAANVKIVTGDTKVVAKGQVDKVFINTSGIGIIPPEVNIQSDLACEGDVILVNGFIGDHGAAIMLARQELGLHASLASDCAPLNDLILQVLRACPGIKVMRDATRGGVGTVLCEIADASSVTMALEEAQLPIRRETLAICELLGMDPLFLANEGLAVFIVPETQANKALEVMHANQYGRHGSQIGRVTNSAQNLLYINTIFNSKRMIEIPYGIQLPRIC
jgi:hydrogenase expression/formation protein HypE